MTNTATNTAIWSKQPKESASFRKIHKKIHNLSRVGMSVRESASEGAKESSLTSFPQPSTRNFELATADQQIPPPFLLPPVSH